jgi:hypothetical protein
MKNLNKENRIALAYSFTISDEERKDNLNKSINRRLSKRFKNVSSVDRFYLTTLFL